MSSNSTRELAERLKKHLPRGYWIGVAVTGNGYIEATIRTLVDRERATHVEYQGQIGDLDPVTKAVIDTARKYTL